MMLGLGYPGGAALSALACDGDPARIDLPRPMMDRNNLDFSFSGLKTAAITRLKKFTAQQHSDSDYQQFRCDLAASFELAVVDVLLGKCLKALQQTGLERLVISGGVSANSRLRQRADELQQGVTVYYPSLQFCTDNGAMIALAGAKRLLMGEQDDLSVRVMPRWPLETLVAGV